MYIVTAYELTRVAGTVLQVELATMCLGLLSHRRSCMSKSSACSQHSSLSGIMMSRSELGILGDQLQYHA